MRGPSASHRSYRGGVGGNADGRPMRETLAIRAAAPLWAAMVDGLLPTDPEVEAPASQRAPRPRRGEPRHGPSSLLPESDGSSLHEWFLAGTEPPHATDAAQSRRSTAQGRRPPLLPRGIRRLVRKRLQYPRSPLPKRRAPRHHPARESRALRRRRHPSARPSKSSSSRARERRGSPVRWFVNERELTASAQGPLYWSLTEGDWHIRAQSGSVDAAEVEISVEANESTDAPRYFRRPLCWGRGSALR